MVVACGQSQQTGDGGVDATVDQLTVDAASDSALDAADGGTSDTSLDAGPKYPPALWSVAIEHVSFADGAWSGDTVGVAFQGSAGLKVAGTTLSGPGAVTGVFHDGDASISPEAVWPYDKNVIEVSAVQDGHGFQQATLTKQGSSSPMQLEDLNLSPGFYQIWSDNANPVPRLHQDTISQVMAFDGLPSGSYTTLQPGGLLIVKRGFGTRTFPGATSTPTLAVDSVRGDTSSRYCLGGRLSGSFDLGSDAGPVNGNGFFIADFVPALTALQWIKVFGGTPLYAVGSAAPEGTGIRLWYNVEDGSVVFTFPFTGSVDFGNNQTFTAPSGGQATAMGVIDASGAVTLVKVFGKGTGSAGKPSRPSAYPLWDSQDKTIGYRLFDTVWDTIDLGGTTATSTAGADVVIADFDSSGKLTSYRVYGGPGDDEAYRITSELPSLNDYVIIGHSMQSIDFGNGSLSTSAAEGEAWVARISP